MTRAITVTRRDFVKVGAAASGGLVIGIRFPSFLEATPPAGAVLPFAPNVFLRVDPDGMVTGVVIADHKETPSWINKVITAGYIDSLVEKPVEENTVAIEGLG